MKPALRQLLEYYDTAQLPAGPVRLGPGEVITDVKRFVAGHRAFVTANQGERGYLPYYRRLEKLREVLEHGNKERTPVAA